MTTGRFRRIPCSLRDPNVLALVALAVLVSEYLLFVGTGVGQRADNWLAGSSLQVDGRVADGWSDLARRWTAPVSATWLVVDCVVRRDLRRLTTGLLSVVLTVGCVHGLRRVLPRPDLGDYGGLPPNSFPSTHVALAVAPLVTIVLVHGLRSASGAICVLLAVVTMAGNTMNLVHRPSDTVGAVAAAVAVTAGIDALLLRLRARRTSSGASRLP